MNEKVVERFIRYAWEYKTSDPLSNTYPSTSRQTDFMKKLEKELKEALMAELIKTEDPRVVGADKEVFDSYERYSPIREFPKPE